jgi:hypothetical protein
MRVLAIDPGNEESAWVIWDGQTILSKGKDINERLLERIVTSFPYDGIDYVVIEMVASYGMAVGQTVFDTCVWIGGFQQAAKARGYDTRLLFRKDVKMYWCGQMRAKDSNIIQAIKDKYGEKGTKKHGFNTTYNDEKVKMKADIWQAFALGEYAFAEVFS